MRKPWWVRVTGFLGLLGGAATVVIFNTVRTMPGNVVGGAFLLFFLLLTVGLLGLWAVMSFVLVVAGRAGRQSAAVGRSVENDLMKAMKVQAAPGPRAVAEPTWDNPATKIRCDVCGRYHAMLYCFRHSLFLCFPCCAKHDQAECGYVASGRKVDDAHKEREGVGARGKVLGI